MEMNSLSWMSAVSILARVRCYALMSAPGVEDTSPTTSILPINQRCEDGTFRGQLSTSMARLPSHRCEHARQHMHQTGCIHAYMRDAVSACLDQPPWSN